jgi:hypothetical protein
MGSQASSAAGDAGAAAAAKAAALAKYAADELTVEAKAGEEVVVGADEVGSVGGSVGKDLRLLNLTDCVVYIDAIVGAMRVDNLKRCHVYARPIPGSVLLHNCTDSVFHFAARQMRIHTSHACRYYIHTMSRPIIEHCASLQFGPWVLTSPQLEADVARAGLRGVDGSKPFPGTKWREVDDFGWHRVQHSPNWEELPPSEWKPEVRCAKFVLCTPSPRSMGVVGGGGGAGEEEEQGSEAGEAGYPATSGAVSGGDASTGPTGPGKDGAGAQDSVGTATTSPPVVAAASTPMVDDSDDDDEL